MTELAPGPAPADAPRLDPYGGVLGKGRARLNRAELVWQMWHGYSPEEAAARLRIGPRTLQRHITALLEDPVPAGDWITAEVVARLRRRAANPGESWEDTVPRDRPARNGWPAPMSRAGRAVAP